MAGKVFLEGEDILARGEESISPHRWKDISMVFQGAMNAFNPVQDDRRARSPSRWSCTARRPARRRKAQVRELLELVGIAGDRADRYPHEFSGGMRQRAAIAMALACSAEGAARRRADDGARRDGAGADPGAAREAEPTLARELGLTVILVTHDLPVVAQVCDRAAVMYAGEIVEMGDTSEIYHDPRHPYTRMLFAATPDLLGRRRGDLDPGGAAAARPRDRRLPVPPALRLGLRAVRVGAPAAARAALRATRRSVI